TIFDRRHRQLQLSIQQSPRAESKTFLLFLAQPVTETADRFNNVSGFSELFAQAPHVGIDSSGVDHAFVAPNLVEQTVALLDAATPLHQRAQQFELKTGEIDTLAVDEDFVARRINRNRPGRQAIVSFFGTATAQDRFDAQNNFARTERFRHVIVSAKFQTDDSIDFFRSRSQHQDRNMARSRFAFQNFANLESRHFRQHQVENDKIRLFRARFGQTGSAISCGWEHDAAGLGKIKREKIAAVL